MRGYFVAQAERFGGLALIYMQREQHSDFTISVAAYYARMAARMAAKVVEG